MDIYYSMKWSPLSQPNQEHNLATVFYRLWSQKISGKINAHY